MGKDSFSDLKDKLKLPNLEAIMGKEYTGDAGAGMVRVTIGSNLKVKKVEIDHTMFSKTAPKIIDDLDFMADLFKAAVNQAIEKNTQDLMESCGLPVE